MGAGEGVRRTTLDGTAGGFAIGGGGGGMSLLFCAFFWRSESRSTVCLNSFTSFAKTSILVSRLCMVACSSLIIVGALFKLIVGIVGSVKKQIG